MQPYFLSKQCPQLGLQKKLCFVNTALKLIKEFLIQ